MTTASMPGDPMSSSGSAKTSAPSPATASARAYSGSLTAASSAPATLVLTTSACVRPMTPAPTVPTRTLFIPSTSSAADRAGRAGPRIDPGTALPARPHRGLDEGDPDYAVFDHRAFDWRVFSSALDLRR